MGECICGIQELECYYIHLQDMWIQFYRFLIRIKFHQHYSMRFRRVGEKREMEEKEKEKGVMGRKKKILLHLLLLLIHLTKLHLHHHLKHSPDLDYLLEVMMELLKCL